MRRMPCPRLKPAIVLLVVVSASAAQPIWGRNLRINIPKRSELTPVQRLNREGVEAILKKQYDKAEGLFYKAYLYDPADPFTLNNLGYISELQGRLDRAEEFYKLASEQEVNAVIDRSNAKQLRGEPMRYALENLKDAPMRVNRMNVDAIQLLSEGRNLEADVLLKRALALDRQNAFTLNNLGVAEEAIGDYDSALKYYREAAESHSHELIVVTLNHSWRGKPVSDVAAQSYKRLKERGDKAGDAERAALFTWHGVSATNRNDWATARQDFLKAYSLDPASGFSLNNLGYVAEKDGDLETAEFFYEKARKANNADARIGLATDRTAQGKRLSSVAGDSDQKLNGEIDQFTESRHQQQGPIELKRRGNTSAPEESPDNSSPAAPSPHSQPPADAEPPE
jgi:tetratricopeptide (TPR) repeat protein